MSVSGELLCSFELLKPLDSAALKNHIKKGRNKRNSILSSPVSSPLLACLSFFLAKDQDYLLVQQCPDFCPCLLSCLCNSPFISFAYKLRSLRPYRPKAIRCCSLYRQELSFYIMSPSNVIWVVVMAKKWSALLSSQHCFHHLEEMGTVRERWYYPSTGIFRQCLPLVGLLGVQPMDTTTSKFN